MAGHAFAACAFACPTYWKCWRPDRARKEILTDFPDLEPDDIRACLAYAANLAGHPVVVAAE
jgi:hypothetical protein